MNFEDSAEEAALRAEARDWLEAHAVAKGSDEDFSSPYGGQPSTLAGFEEAEHAWVGRCRWWQNQLYQGGWAGITWHKAFGGRGGTSLDEAVFAEEQQRYGVTSGAFAVGIGMAGPTIIAHGTPDQKERYLDAMLRGDEVWCQLFSEPDAGSDLAGITTRAVRDGDVWIVDGQKVWTSGASESDWAILLARTDPTQPKHRGITFFLVDMTTPGIDIRPLRQINGAYHFNEVFLSGVTVPHANVLGDVDNGWRVAMTTLTNERHLIGGGGALGTSALIDLARRRGRTDDPRVRQALAAFHTREATLRYLSYRSRTALSQGRSLGPESSVAKLANGTMRTEMADLALAIIGPDGTLSGSDGPDTGRWSDWFLANLASRIGGGTDQIQRNIIAERVLGLPREPAVDRDVAFADLTSSRTRSRTPSRTQARG